MDLELKNKRVLITGGSRGMGKDMALAFAAEGCRVVVLARGEKDLKKLLKEMGGVAKGHDYCAVDLMKEGAGIKAIKALVKKGGAFDIVVHNLGGTLGVKDPLAPMQQWQDVWKLNIGLAIDINNTVVPAMKKKGWGRIIHMSSTASKHFRGAAPYGVTKAYLNAYVESLGRRLAENGIVVAAIMYSVIKVDGGTWDENSAHNRRYKKDFLKRRNNLLQEHQSIGRLGNSEDIVPFVLFTASPQAKFAAGSVIPVTGGGS